VAKYSKELAKASGLDILQIKEVGIVGLLHDIGKIAIPRRVLDQPGKLSSEEWETVKTHARIGYELITGIGQLSHLALSVACDQEFWNGKGYPLGLSGEEIPLYSRLTAVADTFDALTSDRAYRKALPINDALSIIREESGKQFDPNIAGIALSVLPEVYKALSR
jgi:HD-GYP domain-containing protein (c-di-GMP phosphodiesterase class II)